MNLFKNFMGREPKIDALLRKGGLMGMNKIIASTKLGTVELSTGIQISGIFSH